MSAIENLPEPEAEPNAWMEEEHDGVTPWDIRNSVDAAEAMRRAAYFQTQLDDLDAVKKAQIGQIERWHEIESQKIHVRMNKYAAPLKRFADDKQASLTFPAGEVKRTEYPEAVEVDDSTFVAWINSHEVKTSESLVRYPSPSMPPPAADKNAIKRALKAEELKRTEDGELVDPKTGEIIPGAKVTRKPAKVEFQFAIGGA